jgi:competence protein ComEA
MKKTKLAVTFAVGFVVAWLVTRLVAEYLRNVCSQVEMETITVPPRRQSVPPPAAPPQAQDAPAPAASVLNLNTADTNALIALPGVGPALAGRIVAHREKSPFTSVDDLLGVPGIGPALLERLRADVTV